MLDSNQTVAALVVAHSECAEVFRRHRIDFCCRGGVNLNEAARRRGLDVGQLVAELEAAISLRQGDPVVDVRGLSTPALLAHIVQHHELARRAMPLVNALSLKVARVHGAKDPTLALLHHRLMNFAEVFLPHLDAEEVALFPVLADLSVRPGPLPERLLAAMQDDHREVVVMLGHFRRMTNDFEPPEGACASHRALLAQLEALEADTLMHVHLENHVLRPRFVSRG